MIISLLMLFSLSAFGALDELSFKMQKTQEQTLSLQKPLPVNLIKIYRKIDFEKRMIAGYQSNRNETPEKKTWLSGLRTRLEGTRQLRL
jgi:hypothetical protein